MKHHITTVAAIIAILVIEGIALSKGMNGTSLAMSVSTIASIAGYKLGKHNKERSKDNAIITNPVNKNENTAQEGKRRP